MEIKIDVKSPPSATHYTKVLGLNKTPLKNQYSNYWMGITWFSVHKYCINNIELKEFYKWDEFLEQWIRSGEVKNLIKIEEEDKDADANQ